HPQAGQRADLDPLPPRGRDEGQSLGSGGARHSADPDRGHGDRTMTMIKIAGPIAGIGLFLASSAAMAEAKVGADVAVNAGYASNPYGAVGGGSTGSATLSASFLPSVVMTSPTGSTTLGGEVTHTEYTNRYSATT